VKPVDPSRDGYRVGSHHAERLALAGERVLHAELLAAGAFTQADARDASVATI
jgi:hypothetical protein